MRVFFQQIIKSVSDFKFYKHAKDFQTGSVMKYIFSLIFLITVALTIRYTYDVGRGLDIVVDWTNQNLPVIEIQNGVVSVDASQPFKIIEEDFALIIDTTGQVTSLDEYEKGILLTKNNILYKESGIKTESYDLSGVKELRIDENFMKVLRKNFVWILFPFMVAGIFVYFCIAKFLQIFVFSGISLAASSISNIKLSYKQLFNIGVYAITASTILGVLLALLGIQLPLFGFLYIGLYIIYLIMGVLSCKGPPVTYEKSS